MDAKQLEEAIERCRITNPVALTPKSFHAHLLVLEAAAAHLATLPKTKEVEVWHVEYCNGCYPIAAVHTTRATAETQAEDLRSRLYCSCVRVTGPHKHVVPA